MTGDLQAQQDAAIRDLYEAIEDLINEVLVDIDARVTIDNKDARGPLLRTVLETTRALAFAEAAARLEALGAPADLVERFTTAPPAVLPCT